MRLILALIAATILSGCALTDKLTNRVEVTLALDECRVDSRWLGPGITSAIDQRDCDSILAALRLRIYLQVLEQQQRAAGSRL